MSNGSNSNTSGNQVASVDYAPQSGAEKIPNSVRAEVAAFLRITLTADANANTVYQPNEPEDKTKVWYQTDPITGIPQGVAKVWSEEQNQWVASSQSEAPYSPPREQYVDFDAAAGASTKTISIADMGVTNYFVEAEISTFIAGAWESASADMNSFGWQVTNKASNQLTLRVFGVPTGGLHFLLRLRNRS